MPNHGVDRCVRIEFKNIPGHGDLRSRPAPPGKLIKKGPTVCLYIQWYHLDGPHPMEFPKEPRYGAYVDLLRLREDGQYEPTPKDVILKGNPILWAKPKELDNMWGESEVRFAWKPGYLRITQPGTYRFRVKCFFHWKRPEDMELSVHEICENGGAFVYGTAVSRPFKVGDTTQPGSCCASCQDILRAKGR
ncbi:hypothetical protein VTJ49DRAFT_7543 [Mycothermus thermophilus]|uniref:Uncharacterized protein n=1 Tax=Humicola insolens TaxID=85995 RepID=A0ABR3VGK8_HUMIN